MKTAIGCLAIVIGATSVAAAQPYAEPAPPGAPAPAATPPAPAPPPPDRYDAPVYVPVPVPVAEPPRERHGLFASGGLWGGEISCDGADCGGFREAGGAGLQIGYLLTPRFALLFDAWAMTSSKNDISVTFVTTTVGARLWLTPALWVQGGVGNGHAKVSWGIFTTSMSDDVPVASLGAGYEVIRGRSWALDVSLKVAQGSETDSAGNAVSTGRQSGVGVNFVAFLQ